MTFDTPVMDCDRFGWQITDFTMINGFRKGYPGTLLFLF